MAAAQAGGGMRAGAVAANGMTQSVVEFAHDLKGRRRDP
jgi:hypothetical protein